MTVQDQIRTAFFNVGRRKLRSTLASLGVVVGTLTIVIMVSLASGIRQQINRQFASIGLDRLTVTPATDRRGGFLGFEFGTRTKRITAQDVNRWKASPEVAQIVPVVNLPNAAGLSLRWKDTNEPVRLTATGPARGFLVQEPVRPMAGSVDVPESGGIVLSQGAAQAVGIATNDFSRLIGQRVEAVLYTSRGETQSFVLQIRGFSQEHARTIQVSPADRVAMKNWWFNSTNVLEREGYDAVTLRAKDVSGASALTARLKKEGFRVQSLEAVLEVANRVVTVITVLFTMIASIALLVATIGIANTMVMAIYERTREIGVLKAMGASRREIRQMFMLEAGFIGLIGGVLGLVLGWLLGLGLNEAIQIYLKYRELPLRGPFFVVTLWLSAGAVLFATFIGLAAGLLPAQRAASLDPVEALRHE
jgi:putative ABC transport system permease protein